MTSHHSPPGVGRRIFITGGTGFLGAYIIKELVEKNYKVRAIRRSNRIPFFIQKNIFDSVDWVEGDIHDTVVLEEAMQETDIVIHAAAKISFIPAERKEMFKTNIEGTANVVNAALAQRVMRFIHISSIAALGRSNIGAHIDETKQWLRSKLNTNYALSKYHAEMEVWRGIGEGLDAVIVNPSTIIGYGDWNNSSCAIFKSVYEEFPWYSDGINGFVDVEDAARAVVLLMESDVTSERFILNGDNRSFRELLDTIAGAFGKKHPSRKATPFLSELAWRLAKLKSLVTGRPSILTKETARIAQSATYFDNNKIKAFLPAFTFTSFEQTIHNACKSYLSALHN
jgi:dihydroflavonol-4-reductase